MACVWGPPSAEKSLMNYSGDHSSGNSLLYRPSAIAANKSPSFACSNLLLIEHKLRGACEFWAVRNYMPRLSCQFSYSHYHSPGFSHGVLYFVYPRRSGMQSPAANLSLVYPQVLAGTYFQLGKSLKISTPNFRAPWLAPSSDRDHIHIPFGQLVSAGGFEWTSWR